jgi:hypothetical protein
MMSTFMALPLIRVDADESLNAVALQSQAPQSIVVERPEMVDRATRAELGGKRTGGPAKMLKQANPSSAPNMRTADSARCVDERRVSE